MQDIENSFEIKRPATENNLVYIYIAISKPHGNCKPKIYNRYAQKKKKQSKHNTKDSYQITREQKRKGRKKTYKNKSKTINKMAIRTYILTITLNVLINGLNAPTKRHRLAEWIQIQDLYICCLQESLFRSTDTQRLSEEIEKDIPCKGKSKENWSSITYIRQKTLK